MKGKRIAAFLLTMVILVTGNNTVFAGELPEMENMVDATGEAFEEKVEGDYTYTVTNGCATITAYAGTETNIVTPTTLGGYPVTEIGKQAFGEKEVRSVIVSEGIVSVGAYAFWNCQNLYEIEFPSTLQEIGYGGLADTIALKEISVTKNNPVFFSENGILFKHVSKGITLYTYPAAKEENEYRVPYYATSIMSWAFNDLQYLTKIIVPSTITYAYDRIFCESQNPIDVYMNHEEFPDFTPEMFYNMPAGCHVIVKNEQIKKDLEEINIFSTGLSYETPDSSVIVLGIEGYPAIPTTSLTWEGTQTNMSHTLSPGETCQLTYVQEPFNSTDNITWSSSNEKIARVNAVTGLVEASGCVNYPVQTGTCRITGTDESGHSISVDVTVYEPVEEVELGFNELSNPTSYEVVLDEYNNTQWIGIYCTPVSANNAGNVTWESSNPKVATIQADEDEKENALLTYLALGSTTITATLNDNGTIWTKSFVLTITKDIADCAVTSIPDQAYTGSALTPAVTVKDGGKTLVKGTDYTVTYGDNKAAGMAMAVITGKGLYSGTVTAYFNIVKTGSSDSDSKKDDDPGTKDGAGQENDTKPVLKSQSITGVKSSYQKAYGDKAFTLKAKGKITYVSSNSKVASVNKTTGKVSIKGTGTCTITVTAAAATNYKKAVKKITVSVSPKKETVSSVKSLRKGQLTVKWKKDTRATGYEIQYNTSRKFTKKTTKSNTVKKNKTTSQTIKKLKSGKKYYVRVRAYKTVKVSGKTKNLYGSWSNAKLAKTK